MKIRESIETDTPRIQGIHIKAFGEEKGREIASLVNDLFEDKSAIPILSIVAVDNEMLIGHILFTKITVKGSTEAISARILAPLAVLPEAHNKGVGSQLITEGLRQLKESGVELVFVLGHPDYYPRFGFTPAGALGYEAPYPIPEEHAAAWMVLGLCPGVVGKIKGKIQCSDVLNQPEHWRE